MFFARCCLLMMLCCSGCAAPATQDKAAEVGVWPDQVAQVCPKRAISLECFRRRSIGRAMQALATHFQGCYRPIDSPLLVELVIETRGGRAACVERKPEHGVSARCVAQVVAQHLLIPDSPAAQRCSFRYPVKFH